MVQRMKKCCTPCGSSKQKCNRARPACDRCHQKGSRCYYEPAKPVGRPRNVARDFCAISSNTRRQLVPRPACVQPISGSMSIHDSASTQPELASPSSSTPSETIDHPSSGSPLPGFSDQAFSIDSADEYHQITPLDTTQEQTENSQADYTSPTIEQPGDLSDNSWIADNAYIFESDSLLSFAEPCVEAIAQTAPVASLRTSFVPAPQSYLAPPGSTASCFCTLAFMNIISYRIKARGELGWYTTANCLELQRLISKTWATVVDCRGCSRDQTMSSILNCLRSELEMLSASL